MFDIPVFRWQTQLLPKRFRNLTENEYRKRMENIGKSKEICNLIGMGEDTRNVFGGRLNFVDNRSSESENTTNIFRKKIIISETEISHEATMSKTIDRRSNGKTCRNEFS